MRKQSRLKNGNSINSKAARARFEHGRFFCSALLASPYAGEPRLALNCRGAKRQKLRPPATGGPHPSFFCRKAAKEIYLPQGEGLHGVGAGRNLRRKLGVNAITGRGYNPSVFLLQRSKNPALLTQGSRGSLSIAMAQGLHREGESVHRYSSSSLSILKNIRSSGARNFGLLQTTIFIDKAPPVKISAAA